MEATQDQKGKNIVCFSHMKILAFYICEFMCECYRKRTRGGKTDSLRF